MAPRLLKAPDKYSQTVSSWILWQILSLRTSLRPWRFCTRSSGSTEAIEGRRSSGNHRSTLCCICFKGISLLLLLPLAGTALLFLSKNHLICLPYKSNLHVIYQRGLWVLKDWLVLEGEAVSRAKQEFCPTAAPLWWMPGQFVACDLPWLWMCVYLCTHANKWRMKMTELHHMQWRCCGDSVKIKTMFF